MTIEEIEKDGYIVRQVMKKILVTSDKSQDVYISHRFDETEKHWSRPLMIGRAKKGFSKFMANDGLRDKAC